MILYPLGWGRFSSLPLNCNFLFAVYFHDNDRQETDIPFASFLYVSWSLLCCVAGKLEMYKSTKFKIN